MTCDDAIDRSAKPTATLDAERRRSKFRAETLETFLLYLFTYEVPIEKVRGLLDKVETQALRGFPDLRHSGWRAEAGLDLMERLRRLEASTLSKGPFPGLRITTAVHEANESRIRAEEQAGAGERQTTGGGGTAGSLSTEEQIEVGLLKERLLQFSSCVASLSGDTRWIEPRGLLAFVGASDRIEVRRLVEEAWTTLGALEDLVRLLKEELLGKEPTE